MGDKFYIATFSENAVSVARQYGFGIELNDFCISENLDQDKLAGSLDRCRRQLLDAGINAGDPLETASRVVLHGPFTEIIPASIDHRVVSLGMERLEEAYGAAQALGVRRMVVHSGYVPLLYFKDWHHEKSMTFWRTYMDDKPEDFQIYIENVFEDEPLMMRRLVEDLDDSRIRLCLDIGHANAMTSQEYHILDWIRLLGPHIGHFHLHNNDGKSDQHGALTQGTMDMEQVFAAIEAYCREDVTMTIESRTCESGAKWLNERCKGIRENSMGVN